MITHDCMGTCCGYVKYLILMLLLLYGALDYSVSQMAKM